MLTSFAQQLQNTRVDAQVDNKAVVDAWNNQRRRSLELNAALKALLFTTARLNISLHLSSIPSGENLADAPSRRFSFFDNKLSEQIWDRLQEEFGGDEGQSRDLMSLDSNAMKDRIGNSLPHFTTSTLTQFCICLRKIFHSMAISCPAHVFFPLLYWLDQYWNSWDTTKNPSHLLSWTLFQGNIGGLLLREKQLRHGNWLLLAIQTPCYSHQSMAGCPINTVSLASSEHWPHTFEIRKKRENPCGCDCVVPSGRDNERDKKWSVHISVTWLILINGPIITENSISH